MLAMLIVGCSRAPAFRAGKEADMNIKELETRLVAKDESAPALARQLAGGAEPVLERMAKHPDGEVRQLNVSAIYQAAAPQRNKMLLAALGDNDINVRSAAVRFLASTADAASLPGLQMQVAGNEDEYVRAEIALIVGRIGDKSAASVLSARLPVEEDPDVKHSIVLALARLGDGKAREIIKLALASPDPQVRLQTVRDYEYINNPRWLVDLKPALADFTDVWNINPPHVPVRMIRLCDVAVIVIAKVAKPKLSFDGTERKRFGPEQLAEVIRAVDSIR